MPNATTTKLMHMPLLIKTIAARPRRTALALVLCVLGFFSTPVAANSSELGINIYGFSYHFDRERAKSLGLEDEFNPGIGLRYRVPKTKGLDWFIDFGLYRDSGGNIAKLAALSVSGMWNVSERLKFGAALALLNSATYNEGRPFIAPLPLLSYELQTMTLNMVYLPKFSGHNDVNALGFWVTYWLP